MCVFAFVPKVHFHLLLISALLPLAFQSVVAPDSYLSPLPSSSPPPRLLLRCFFFCSQLSFSSDADFQTQTESFCLSVRLSFKRRTLGRIATQVYFSSLFPHQFVSKVQTFSRISVLPFPRFSTLDQVMKF